MSRSAAATRILVTTFGTRGDVQPYAALGGALRDRGHDVTLAVPEGFRDLADGVGVRMRAAGSRMLRMLQEVMPELSGPRDALKTLGVMREAMREHLDEQWAAAQGTGPDLIVYHPKCLAGPHMAEALGVPGALSIPLPFYTPTSAFRSRSWAAHRSAAGATAPRTRSPAWRRSCTAG